MTDRETVLKLVEKAGNEIIFNGENYLEIRSPGGCAIICFDFDSTTGDLIDLWAED